MKKPFYNFSSTKQGLELKKYYWLKSPKYVIIQNLIWEIPPKVQIFQSTYSLKIKWLMKLICFLWLIFINNFKALLKKLNLLLI